MKTRVFYGLTWGSLAILTAFFAYSPLMGVLISIFAVGAAHEIQKVAGVKNLPILITSHLFAFALPLVVEYDLLKRFGIPLMPIIVIYFILLMCFMLQGYEKTKFEHVAVSFVASVFVPYALSCFMLVRDLFKVYPESIDRLQALYLFLLAIVCSWMTDAYAYFVGSKLGKRKMSPKISPKKSIEGAVGGVVCTLILNLVALYFFNKFFLIRPIPFYFVIPASVLLSIIGMLGDLSASAVKRNYGVKDFGTFMKGHGGVMDRFDSCIFVFPAFYATITLAKVFI
ncbi:MAG: phosphatidate cytidylyltransferase [Clostridiales bacterium]|jgi:phosphatidate cytidylyltransferase|nr:phosphatidate cytidylyltransferase [Clostridiales bacterium]